MGTDSSPYSPRFFSALEDLILLRRPVEIIYRADNGGRTVIRDSIAEIYTHEGRDMLKTGKGVTIRAEDLLEVDGMKHLGHIG